MRLRQKSVAASLAGIQRGMSVYDAGGTRLGKVRGLIVAESRVPTHLILRHTEPLLFQDRALPVEFVEEVSGGKVQLSVNADHIYSSGLCLTVSADAEVKSA